MRGYPIVLGAVVIGLTGASLPDQGPVPERKPAIASEAGAPRSEGTPQAGSGAGPADNAAPTSTEAKGTAPALPVTGPTPTPSPEAKTDPSSKTDLGPKTGPAAQDAKAKDKPGAEPAAGSDTKGGTGTDKGSVPGTAPAGTTPAAPATDGAAAAPAKPSPPPIETEDPAAYAQCLTDLKAAGVEFEEKPRIDDGDGCGVDKPVEVKTILPNVSLQPKAVFRCQAALELSEWLKTVVIPAAEQALPDKGRLKTVYQASSYVCRNRNSLAIGKLSEHAHGNAIDIAAFGFEKDKVPMLIVSENEPTINGAFQRTINASACLYFTTVLAPGSDPTHGDHMHLDLIKRRNEMRVCRTPD